MFFATRLFAQEKTSGVDLSNQIVLKRLEFKDAKLVDAVRLIAESTGLNITVTPEAGEKSVKLFLKDIPPREALKTMCKLYNLWFVEDEKAIRIMSVKDYGKELTIKRDEKTFIYKLKYASSLAVAELLETLYGERIEYLEPDESESYGHVGTEDDDREDGSRGFGSSSRSDNSRAGNRNSRDRNRNNNRNGNRNNDRFRPRTNRIDSTFAASRQANEALEIEKSLSSGIIENLSRKVKGNKIEYEDARGVVKGQAVVNLAVFLRNNSIMAHSVDIKILKDIGAFIKKIDTPTTQVLLEGKILEITLTDDFNSFFNFDVAPGSGKNKVSLGNFTPLDSATVIFDSIHSKLQARMELFKEKNQVKVIGTPMILSANNALGDFFIGEERTIVVNYEQEIREFEERTTETLRPVIELRDIGTKLTITPSINEDSTVTMRFLAEVDTVNVGGSTISFVSEAGAVLALPIDTVNTSRVENIFVAKDGATIAVGGLIRETDRDFQRKVPFFGNIPLLGFFFKKKERKKEKKETVFLITPHIMMRPQGSADVSNKTISRLSDHPHSKNGHKELLHYDERKKELSTDHENELQEQSRKSGKIKKGFNELKKMILR